ncbi:hypothetical protein AMJ80_03650 [bacterium SM23_31]|nr:MAG: hypothetical protein AMJ80_03650 [bacterium SM23_31]
MIVKKDEELIKACTQGDHAAFDILFKKYARPLTFFIDQILHNRNRAEDIFQDTFIKVLENAGKFDNRYKFSTWIYRIALNLCINELRKRQRENRRIYSQNMDNIYCNILDRIPYLTTPVDILEKKECANRINDALSYLSVSKRTAFVLKFYHHLSYEEIGEIMNCSTGTVKSRIHYAVEKIQVIVRE